METDVSVYANQPREWKPSMMSTQSSLFTPLALETAPEASRPLQEKIRKSYKFIPNRSETLLILPSCLRAISAWKAYSRKAV